MLRTASSQREVGDAQVLAARAQVVKAQSDLARAKELSAKQIISMAQLDAAQAAFDAASATLTATQRQVSAAAGLYVGQVVQAISNLRGSVGGMKDQGLSDNAGNMIVAPADRNGVAFGRSTREVLNIVYLAPNATKGGFYPNGLTGSIK